MLFWTLTQLQKKYQLGSLVCMYSLRETTRTYALWVKTNCMNIIKKTILTATGKTYKELKAELKKFSELYESPETFEKLNELLKKYFAPYNEFNPTVDNLVNIAMWQRKYPFIYLDIRRYHDKHSKETSPIKELEQYPSSITVQGERGIPGHAVLEVAEMCKKLLMECNDMEREWNLQYGLLKEKEKQESQ